MLLAVLAQPWDLKRAALVATMAVGAVLGLVIPFTRNFFAMEWPGTHLWAVVLIAGALGGLLVVLSYRLTAKWRQAGTRPESLPLASAHLDM